MWSGLIWGGVIPMLVLRHVEAGYGPARVLHGVSLRVDAGEIVCLLGSNGAGKTTTLLTILGLLKPTSGSVEFLDQQIDGLETADIVRRGIAIVPEGRRVFGSMSVEENLKIAAAVCGRSGADRSSYEMVFDLFPDLADRKQQLAGTMSGGQQQMLAIARALITGPRLILMDEPSMGLSPVMAEKVFDIISRISTRGVAVLLVEQNAYTALDVATRGYVMQAGMIVLENDAERLRESELVREAYL